ncbi:hypothetical protein CR513_09823, partial [Mucuna pruriens]
MIHLAMYCQKMVAYIYDDKVLIHCIQNSLIGAALNWYVNLERGCIKTRKDLVEAFLKQYMYNEDMAPDRSWLQNMVKKEQEGFKEYAQRWRDLAVQVQPPITKMEMVTMVVGNVASNFTDLVVVCDKIELGIRGGKFAQTSNNAGFVKKPVLEKKKGETNVVLVKPVFHQKKANAPSQRQRHQYHTSPRVSREPMPGQPLKLVEIVPLKPLEPLYLRSYDPKTRCDYHGGAVGHATERCWSLNPRPTKRWSAQILGPRTQCTELSSSGPQRHGDQCNKPRKQG